MEEIYTTLGSESYDPTTSTTSEMVSEGFVNGEFAEQVNSDILTVLGVVTVGAALVGGAIYTKLKARQQ